jgi:hypothetical protein
VQFQELFLTQYLAVDHQHKSQAKTGNNYIPMDEKLADKKRVKADVNPNSGSRAPRPM